MHTCVCLSIVPALKDRSAVTPYHLGVQPATHWVTTTWCIQHQARDYGILFLVFLKIIDQGETDTCVCLEDQETQRFNREFSPDYHAWPFVSRQYRGS